MHLACVLLKDLGEVVLDLRKCTLVEGRSLLDVSHSHGFVFMIAFDFVFFNIEEGISTVV